MARGRLTGREHNARYGARHRRVRAAYAARIAAGETFTCRRCGEPVTAGQSWHLDHGDSGEAADYLGPSHASCNISAPGVRGAAADSVARYRGEGADAWPMIGGSPAPRVNAWWEDDTNGDGPQATSAPRSAIL